MQVQGRFAEEQGLVEGMCAGRAESFARVMRAHNQSLFRVARAVLGNEADAEDAVQETYLKAFTAIGSFSGGSSLRTWLTRIAINEALGRLRRKKVVQELETVVRTALAEGNHEIGLSLAMSRAPSENPEQRAARAELRVLVERAINELPPDFRLTFVLCAVEQHSAEEASELLGIPAETVRTRMFRARRSLRRALGEQIGSSVTDAFPFAGTACDRVVERVLERLHLSSR